MVELACSSTKSAAGDPADRTRGMTSGANTIVSSQPAGDQGFIRPRIGLIEIYIIVVCSAELEPSSPRTTAFKKPYLV